MANSLFKEDSDRQMMEYVVSAVLQAKMRPEEAATLCSPLYDRYTDNPTQVEKVKRTTQVLYNLLNNSLPEFALTQLKAIWGPFGYERNLSHYD